MHERFFPMAASENHTLSWLGNLFWISKYFVTTKIKYTLVASLQCHSQIPLLWPHGIVKYPSYAHFRISLEVHPGTFCYSFNVNSDILISLLLIQFFTIYTYSRQVCNFGCSYVFKKTNGLFWRNWCKIGMEMGNCSHLGNHWDSFIW